MTVHSKLRITLAAVALALLAGSTESRADSCSASTSSLVTRSDGGACDDALTLNQIFTLTYRTTNAAVIDDSNSVNNGEFVESTIFAGNELVATLAQETTLSGATELPTMLEFIPVCSDDSSLNAGDECNPAAPDCGTGDCGCVSSQPGVTCVASGANKVNIEFGQDLVFGPGQQLTIATIRVKSTDTLGPPAVCGEFFTRIESTGDIMTTTDDQCSSEVTADSEGSANLHAPACVTDEDCGECGVCADPETDPHCENAAQGTACTADAEECTTDQCDIDGNCQHVENDNFCNDDDPCTADSCSAQGGCFYDLICEGDAICRSPGYWATHSGYEKTNSVNVGQLVIDAVGPIEVCGQTITATSNQDSPYLDGLGLTSDLEGLCSRGKGVPQRQLYRQLVAAALNCGISGDACETVTGPFIDVSFEDCSDVCAGNPPAVDAPSIGECVAQLDCFNNGGQIINGDCAFGTCANESDVNCGGDFGDCPDFEAQPQECVDFPNNCHSATLCNEAIGVCPKKTPASSSAACREARGNDCTIDDCD